MTMKNLQKVGIVDEDKASSSPVPVPANAKKEEMKPVEKKLSETKLVEEAAAVSTAKEDAKANDRPDDADAAAGDDAVAGNDAAAGKDAISEEDASPAAIEEIAIAPEQEEKEAAPAAEEAPPPAVAVPSKTKISFEESDDDSGVDPESEAIGFMIQALRSQVGESKTKNVSDATLAKFLRWKPDVQRAAVRYEAHLKWQKSHQGYVAYHEKPSRLSVDSELLKSVSAGFVASPDDLFDKTGGRILLIAPRENEPRERRSTVLIQRTIHYVIDRMLEDPRSQKNGVTIILDLAGTEAGGGFDGQLPKLLSSCASAFPMRVKGIHIFDAGFWFSTNNYHWYLSKKLQERVHHLNDPADLYDVVDWEVLKGLNVGHGLGKGKRHKNRKNIAQDALGSNAAKGVVVKFVPSEWSARMLLREVNGETSSLGEINDEKGRRPKSWLGLGATPLLLELES